MVTNNQLSLARVLRIGSETLFPGCQHINLNDSQFRC